MSVKIGERVGAVLSIHKDAGGPLIKMLGYGVLVGEEVPTEEALGMGGVLRDLGMTNPKIQLDDGSIVWGCECWWGPEDEIKDKEAQAHTVRYVNINEHRKEKKG